jgi:hypothetical protein
MRFTRRRTIYCTLGIASLRFQVGGQTAQEVPRLAHLDGLPTISETFPGD